MAVMAGASCSRGVGGTSTASGVGGDGTRLVPAGAHAEGRQRGGVYNEGRCAAGRMTHARAQAQAYLRHSSSCWMRQCGWECCSSHSRALAAHAAQGMLRACAVFVGMRPASNMVHGTQCRLHSGLPTLPAPPLQRNWHQLPRVRCPPANPQNAPCPLPRQPITPGPQIDSPCPSPPGHIAHR